MKRKSKMMKRSNRRRDGSMKRVKTNDRYIYALKPRSMSPPKKRKSPKKKKSPKKRRSVLSPSYLMSQMR